MQKQRSVTVAMTLAMTIALWGVGVPQTASQTSRDDSALTGLVSSDSDARMEGVLVKAKRVGSNITVTVVSNDQGRYRFPASRLVPGSYDLDIRAVGYELQAPLKVDIAADRSTDLGLRLERTRDIASQLSNAEWLMSFPGYDTQKTAVECVGCHSLEIVARSRHKDDAWYGVLDRMNGYAPGSILSKPQKNPFVTPPGPKDPKRIEYLNSINSSAGEWKYELKTLPRPKGRATQVIITEYDLPTPSHAPHDVVVDKEGFVWYADFGRPFLGKLNPKTGVVTEYPLPILKPGYPEGANPTELDQVGNIYVGRLKQAAVAFFDRKTETVKQWSVPAEYNNERAHVGMMAPPSRDGTIWFTEPPSARLHRLDTKTGKIETSMPFGSAGAGLVSIGYMPDTSTQRPHAMYGLSADSKGNAYIFDMGGGTITKVDARTMKVTYYPTPTPNSGPRRGTMDAQDRLWIGEYYANKVAMFDTKTGEFQEWAQPGPWGRAYDAMVDKNGEVWTGGMHTDYLYRLNTKTGEWVQYLLPTLNINLRRMGGVDSSTSPVTVWVGENLQGRIAKVEPLN